MIRKNILSPNVKNPELTIGDYIADNKMVNGFKGITDGFRKAIAQGCQAVVIDLDARLKRLNIQKVAKRIQWRHENFEKGSIKECYVVFEKKAVVITQDDISLENITAILQQLKQ